MEYEYLRRYRDVLETIKAMPAIVSFVIPREVQELFAHKPGLIHRFYEAIVSNICEEPWALSYTQFAQDASSDAQEQWLIEKSMALEHQRILFHVADNLHGYFPYGHVSTSRTACAVMKYTEMELVEYVSRKRPSNRLQ